MTTELTDTQLIRKFIEAYVIVKDSRTAGPSRVYGDDLFWGLHEWEQRMGRRIDVDYKGLIRAVELCTGCTVRKNRKRQDYFEGICLQ